MPITIETYTALLKGYAHSGMLHKGFRLFKQMCEIGNPNVRSLNTLLRGCLWTAATLENGSLAGGVVTSDFAWRRSRYQDSSSFEYYVTQLCQSLRLDDARDEIERFKQIMKIETTRNKKGDIFKTEDRTSMESLSVCLLAFTRAQALLGLDARHIGTSALNAVDVAVCGNTKGTNEKAYGGKRSWKKDESHQRVVSNTRYREHRLNEIRDEVKAILEALRIRKPKPKQAAKNLCKQLLTRFFYFSGGGTTTSINRDEKLREKCVINSKDIITQLTTSNWVSFGLKSAFLKFDGSALSRAETLNWEQCKQILKTLKLDDISLVNEKGFVCFSKLFSVGHQKGVTRPLNIELGSGFGDWAVYQATCNPEQDYVAVELRADRIAQTFARAMLSGKALRNLCCVGADCGLFLRERVEKNTVSTVFVNHPEPPTQTFGSNEEALSKIAQGGDEPAHILNSSIIIAAAECLAPIKGWLVIVTDNRMHARLICASIKKAMTLEPSMIKPACPSNPSKMKRVEVLWGVSIYEGQPSESIRHSVKTSGSGQSYFDRLWKTGAGTHADCNKRFIMMVQRE